MVLCELVVHCVLGCGCVVFGIVVWVQVMGGFATGGLGCGSGYCESVLF